MAHICHIPDYLICAYVFFLCRWWAHLFLFIFSYFPLFIPPFPSRLIFLHTGWYVLGCLSQHLPTVVFWSLPQQWRKCDTYPRSLSLEAYRRELFHVFSPKLYWDIINISHCVTSKCPIRWPDKLICCKAIAVIWLVNTSHRYLFVCVWWEYSRSTLLGTVKCTMEYC